MTKPKKSKSKYTPEELTCIGEAKEKYGCRNRKEASKKAHGLVVDMSVKF